ncbi:MAG: LytR C-terminal domain-containing protein [Acidimicrobiia bacterium]
MAKGDQNSQSSFSSPTSTRALGLVAVAVLIGLLLVVIIDSDNSSKKSSKAQSSQSTSTTTTSKSTSTSTTTTTLVTGAKKPAEVSVLVLNGSNIAGVASTISQGISKLGYKTLTAGNDTSKDAGTIVYYKAGFEKDAKQLATNVVPGLLKNIKMTQTVTSKQFPASAPVAWDQDNLISANLVVVVGNA